VKLIDKAERTDGTFSRSDFVFDPESNLYVCPGGTELRKYHRAFAKPRDGLTKDGTMILKLIDKAERTDGTFSRSDFVFDPDSNLYVCPGGQELRKYHRAFAKPRDGLTKDGTMIYFARKQDCEACALKPKCCPNVPARKSARSVHEAAADGTAQATERLTHALTNDASLGLIRYADAGHPEPLEEIEAHGVSQIPVS
jgi:hypothetical protein